MRYIWYAGALALFLCTHTAYAATWCTRPECFSSKSTPIAPSCVVKCDSKPDGLIPLGEDELKLTCAIAETEYPFCPSTTTTTTTTTTTSTSSTSSTSSEALVELTKQTQAQTEKAYLNAYEQFLSDLNTSVTTTTTQSNIQSNTISEISWRDLFRTGVRSSGTQVTTTTTPQNTATKNTVCADTFTRNFRLGAVHEEVKLVQKFLNASADTTIAATGAQSKGKETTAYNTLTRDAVNKFQQKYANDVLGAVSETKPTGFWGPFTRKKANELVCSGAIKLE